MSDRLDPRNRSNRPKIGLGTTPTHSESLADRFLQIQRLREKVRDAELALTWPQASRDQSQALRKPGS